MIARWFAEVVCPRIFQDNGGKERKLYVPNTTNAMIVNFNNGNVNNNNKTNNNYVRCVRAGAWVPSKTEK